MFLIHTNRLDACSNITIYLSRSLFTNRTKPAHTTESRRLSTWWANNIFTSLKHEVLVPSHSQNSNISGPNENPVRLSMSVKIMWHKERNHYKIKAGIRTRRMRNSVMFVLAQFRFLNTDISVWAVKERKD